MRTRPGLSRAPTAVTVVGTDRNGGAKVLVAPAGLDNRARMDDRWCRVVCVAPEAVPGLMKHCSNDLKDSLRIAAEEPGVDESAETLLRLREWLRETGIVTADRVIPEVRALVESFWLAGIVYQAIVGGLHSTEAMSRRMAGIAATCAGPAKPAWHLACCYTSQLSTEDAVGPGMRNHVSRKGGGRDGGGRGGGGRGRGDQGRGSGPAPAAT